MEGEYASLALGGNGRHCEHQQLLDAASDNLFLRGVRINPPMLKRRSTGAEEGKEVLYFRNGEKTLL